MDRRDDIDEHTLWERLRTRRDNDARAHLIERFAFLAKVIAGSLYARRHLDDVAFEDFYQLGLVGLIESVDRYDPARGASFETFASYRIRGAILNGLERASERRTQLAASHRMRKERLRSLVAGERVGRQDLFEEMVELTLGLAVGYMLEGTALVSSSSLEDANRPYQTQELAQLKQILVGAVYLLPERERRIIEGHYIHGLRFDDLACDLGLSKGRISQLHKRALQSLRAVIHDSGFDAGF